jgi:hypothetical protein
VDDLGVEGGVESPVDAEALSAGQPHANNVFRVLRSTLTHGVDGGFVAAAPDPHLAPDGSAEGRQYPRVCRTVLWALSHIVLPLDCFPYSYGANGHD